MAVINAAIYLWSGLSGAAGGKLDPAARGSCTMTSAASTAESYLSVAAGGHVDTQFQTQFGDGYSPLPVTGVLEAPGFCEMHFSGTIARESILAVAGICRMKSAGSVRVCESDMGASVRDAVEAVLRVWNSSCDKASGGELDEALDTVNAALQQLYQKGKQVGFVAEELHETSFDVVPVESFALPDRVQSVVDIDRIVVTSTFPPPRRVIRPRPVRSREELERIRMWYKVSPEDNAAFSLSIPVAYYVEHATQGNVSDFGVVRSGPVVHLAPRLMYPQEPLVPDPQNPADWALATVLLRVIKRPPRYSRCDLPGRLDVPHEYCETLLFPLARYYALSSKFARNLRKESQEAILSQVAQIRSLLGESDPRPAIIQTNRQP